MSRLVPLIFTKSFYGKEDIYLTEKLLQERAGIVNWVLAGYERLQQRGYFEIPQTARTAIRQLEDLASPVKAFLRVRCVVKAGQQVGIDELYLAWAKWQEAHNYKAMSKPVFGRDIHAACPGVVTRQRRSGRYYDGIGLKLPRRKRT